MDITFRDPFFMTTDGCGLDELLCDCCLSSKSSFPLLFHFHHLPRRWELERGEVFFFSSMFQLSWPRMIVNWMDCNMNFCYEYNVELCIVVPIPTPSDALGFGTWRSIFFFRVPFSHDLGWLWIGWAAICTSVWILY